MNYKKSTFTKLVEEVENQGGALLPDKCLPDVVEFKEPQHDIPDSYTCGCGNVTKLVSLYDPNVEERKGGSGYAPACAVCDNMGAWPRYAAVVKADDNSYWVSLDWDEPK